MSTRIVIRRDTAARWTSANPVLLAGEVGYETDTRKQKVGDGVTAWTSLGYSLGSTATQPRALGPGDYGWGGWNFAPTGATTGTVLAADGTLYLSKMPVQAGDVISNLIHHVATAGATLTSGRSLAGLFSSAGVLLATSADLSGGGGVDWLSTGVKVAPITPQTMTA